jgi:medium-chain acyl-[acyl-carrier-protein] hydrolase
MPSDSARMRWIVCRRPSSKARVRLFCFPYAGGGASIFARWPQYLPEEIELNAMQLPGHEDRIADSPYTDLGSLLSEVTRNLQPLLDKPFALLGHSMGALICYELARKIRRDFRQQPARLFLSGLRALQIPNPDTPLHSLGTAEFLQQLQARYGMPSSILCQSELLDLFVPLLQADFQLCETYAYTPEPPFDCPMSVFGGLEDCRVSRGDLAAWKSHTTGSLRLRMLEGNHYFFEHLWVEMARAVAQDLAEYVPAPTQSADRLYR